MVTTAEAMGISDNRLAFIYSTIKKTYINEQTVSDIIDKLVINPDLTKSEKIFAIYAFGSLSH